MISASLGIEWSFGFTILQSGDKIKADARKWQKPAEEGYESGQWRKRISKEKQGTCADRNCRSGFAREG